VGITANSTLIQLQWTQTVLKNTEIAYDSFWQFASKSLPGGEDYSDIYGLYFNTTEYALLVLQHAKDMLAKNIWGRYD
jgi:mannan endo-1,4-beta-mannosidase